MQHACDVALLIPSWSEVKDWRERTHLYVHQRPLAVEEGSRVWLCKDRRFVYSYRIEGFVDLQEALPGETTQQEETGWALVVSDGKRANRDIDAIPDAQGVAARWMQGFRYLEPGATAFVKAPRRPRQAPVVEPEPPGPEPAPAPESIRRGAPSWAVRAARRLGRRS